MVSSGVKNENQRRLRSPIDCDRHERVRRHSYETRSMPHVLPETPDGIVSEVATAGGSDLLLTCTFQLPPAFLTCMGNDTGACRFASRSRIARLGIDLVPQASPEFNGSTATLVVALKVFSHNESIARAVPRVFLPGLPIGRLVLCPGSSKLEASQVYDAYRRHELQLPASFAIDVQGKFTIQPHRLVYEIPGDISEHMLLTVLHTDTEGRALLNRMQVPKRVDNIVVPPGEAIITSCSMYLHRHYVVLDTAHTALGRHLHAVVLDPVTTRGRQVFLEIVNHARSPLVNPSVIGTVYKAIPIGSSPEEACARNVFVCVAATTDPPPDYTEASECFVSCPPDSGRTGTYFDRPIALLSAPGEPDAPNIDWIPTRFPSATALEKRLAKVRVATPADTEARFSTSALDALPARAGNTLLIRRFPNLSEHIDICAAAIAGTITRMIFQHASFEHGEYLSARDHNRLADYEDLGMDVHWCNPIRDHLAAHVYRGHRGFFCVPEKAELFRRSLVVAVYGSSVEVPEYDYRALDGLVGALKDFFGSDLAVMTGGGPGVMKRATHTARDLRLLTGACYLEIETQENYFVADFYQVFQDSCRHIRQRWFDIASFPIFAVGGVGTSEEIGTTLTDIKLGVSERVPIVFFGRKRDGALYWKAMVRQLREMADIGRGPSWLRENILLTDKPDEVIGFYQSVLGLG